MEVHSKRKGGNFATAQICKRKHRIWGAHQELVVTLPPVSFPAL